MGLGHCCYTEMFTFTEDDVIELSLLRDEEIDVLVERGFVPEGARFEPGLRESISFSYPEMSLKV